MTLSLRGRLLIGVISLVVLGILVFDFATYATMQSFLLSRVDSQLTLGRAVAVRALGGPNEGPGSASAAQFPTGTVIERVAPDGTLVDTRVSGPAFTNPSAARPVLPRTLPNAGMDKAGDRKSVV